MDPELLTRLRYACYLACVMAQMAIRWKPGRRAKHAELTRVIVTRPEFTIVTLLGLGMLVVPSIPLFSDVLTFADNGSPPWLALPGVTALIASLYVLWRAHAGLGDNFLLVVGLKRDHKLVKSGIYSRIRHPMYASVWLWAIGQALVLPNWVAAGSTLLLFGPVYALRVRREEMLLLEHFGNEFLQYASTTGRVFPRIRNSVKNEETMDVAQQEHGETTHESALRSTDP